MQWYHAIGGQQQGPVEESEMQRLAREGQLAQTDLVWHAGLGNQWAAAGTVCPHWFAASPPPPPVSEPVSELPNAELMRLARESLKGRWGSAVGITLLYLVIVAGVRAFPIIGPIIGLLITGPLIVGFATVFLHFARRQEAEVGQLFSGFGAYGRNLGANLLTGLFVFLWMLLLIIPGLIAAYAYAMTPYILAEDPKVGAREAIRRSKAMMQGNKFKLFCLGLRFVGWVLLCMLTLGIGLLWLVPYMNTSVAQFYLNVSRRAPQST